MRRITFILLFIAFGVSLKAQNAQAELARQYIREKLIFYYVDDPSEGAPSDWGPFNVDKNAIAEGRDIDSPLWTNAVNRGLRQLLVGLLRAPDNGGDLELQLITSEVLLITNKKINVFLYNDSENAVPDSDWTNTYIYCDPTGNANNKCWPCASHWRNRSKAVGGHIALGAGYFDPSGNINSGQAKKKTSTFLHELAHTQIKNVRETSVPASNRYGVPGKGHFFNEILPSKNSAFNEGVASSFAFRYYLPLGQNVISWYNTNARLWVDDLSDCSGSGTPVYRCMQDRLRVAGETGVAVTSSSGIAGRMYRIRDLAPEFLVHNETVLANLIFEYTRQFNDPFKLIENIRDAHPSIAGNSGDNFTFSPLYKEMLKTGATWRTPGTTDTVRGEVLLAGITDFYLGYRMNSQPILESAFGSAFDATYPAIDDYFSTHRTELHGLRQDTTTWSQVQLRRFGERLNVIPTAGPSAGGISDGN